MTLIPKNMAHWVKYKNKQTQNTMIYNSDLKLEVSPLLL